jgi:hypothetical protein
VKERWDLSLFTVLQEDYLFLLCLLPNVMHYIGDGTFDFVFEITYVGWSTSFGPIPIHKACVFAFVLVFVFSMST